LLDILMSPKVSSQGYGIDSNTLAMLQRDQVQVVRGKGRCAKIVISPIWQSGRGSRVLLGSILTFVQLQEYVCHHKQSETDCIQLICMPTDQQFVPYWPWDTEQRACSGQETMWISNCVTGLLFFLQTSQRSWRTVLFLGRPELGLSATLPVCWNPFHNLEMTLWEILNCPATALWTWPAWIMPTAWAASLPVKWRLIMWNVSRMSTIIENFTNVFQ
jgi:hypothetical protein